MHTKRVLPREGNDRRVTDITQNKKFHFQEVM